MTETSPYLLVALSGRALTVAARRAGRRAVVLDLFGDTDTRSHAEQSRVVAGSLAEGFDEAALLAAAEEIAPAGTTPAYGFVYGSGLEDRPRLLARLCAGRRLCGNDAERVALTKDPRSFFPLLARLGVPHPSVSFEPPADSDGWLVKRIGASGGSHVAPASAGGGESCYYQRRVPGRAIGASFLADGRRALLLGFSELWPWPGAGGGSFLFGGALQPAPLDPAVAAAIPGLLDAIVAEIGLVGLNSLDMMVDGADFRIIEINPRPGANLDIFDVFPVPLFELHLQACAGRLPEAGPSMSRASAMAVVYAERPSLVPADLRWPDWVADRPAPGARIEAGAPVCTVLATAPTAALVRPLVDSRAAAALSLLQAAEAPARPAHEHAAGP